MKEGDLAFLLDKCPVLEKLLIVGSRWPVCLRVQSGSILCVEVCTAIVSEITVLHAPCLERLLLWEAWGGGGLTNMCSRVKIGHAPKLRFLGFLVPGMHELEIGNTIIKLGKARMLPSFLRCFPNVETLYIQSDNDGIKLWETPSSHTGEFKLKFLKEAGSIECVQNNIKKLVFRECRGNRNELYFLKFIAEHARVLEEMVIVLTNGCSPSDLVCAKLRTFMACAKWASVCCKLMVFQSSFHQEGTTRCHQQAFDLSNQDPFDVSRCPRGNV
ncbi:hypothetical protein BAE44_0003014 [Dichanthelium oligosanthes]|uniref:Uncharacterized protein n=1 Tax=Dichanthelium oligosanthes TaxID=888268 RepID=A0A1E5WF50_9POAL|nr:hypothetical protein BAE44_0003014 [Dichanthelium oligosanthes]